jgi:NAD(P)-dependent dehydrogenase (short-subunit alcohol dehydrogenase family)
VNLSSTFGHRPLPGGSHYAASKSAIEMLTQSWALELAEENVRVNAVAPCPTESEALAASGLSGEAVDKIKQDETARIPLGRRGKPEDIAAWIVHLGTPRPLGLRDRSSPSTAALNSPDRQRVRKVRMAMSTPTRSGSGWGIHHSSLAHPQGSRHVRCIHRSNRDR